MEIDQAIGGYRLRNLIATGLASQIWEVVEQASGRHFAIKTLLPKAAGDPEQRQMLLNEAKIGQELAHPNIIKIVAVKNDKYQPYFVMEFFPAGSMKLRIANKQTDFIREQGQFVFKQIATALAYMNSSGWVHRDIKPDNILANSAGEAKLIDFAISQKARKSVGFFESLFGKKAQVQGTRSYMSPEQIKSEPLDARADVYSFGATLYEIVTLRPPFRGASSQELLNKQLAEKPLTPQAHNPDVTDDFAKLVLDMLAKKKEHRPHNFHEVLMRLKTMRVFKSQAVHSTQRIAKQE